MANFVLSNTPQDQWLGGPPAYCHACNFINVNSGGFLILPAVHVLMHDQIEVPLHLCLAQHAKELFEALTDIYQDDRLAKAQGAALSANAARARAEKRADKAEAALHAMQDWIAETPSAK